MKKLILLLAFCLAMCFAGEAKYPAVGDYVRINQENEAGITVAHEGNITDISDGLICLNCTNAVLLGGSQLGAADLNYPIDICIGTGQINSLVWLVPE